MRHLQRKLYPITCSFLLILVASCGPQGHQSTTPAPASGQSMLRSASGDSTLVDTLTLVVPANRAARGAGTVQLKVVRFPATAAAGAPPVIYLSGGSGSGIAAARGARWPMFLALRELGDVVTLDLRGAGASTPGVACAPPRLPLDTVLTYETLTAVLRRHAGACADTLRARGVDLAGHNVREVVGDIESLRIALGAERLRLVGISTGTQLALEYMRRFPGRVHSAVLAGVQSPHQILHLPLAAEHVLARFDGIRPRTPGDSTSLLALMRAALDRLSLNPRTINIAESGAPPVMVAVGPFDLQLLVAGVLGDRRQMGVLPALLGSAARGEHALLARMKAGAARGGITSAYEALMDCQTSATQARADQWALEARSALIGQGTLDFPAACTGWGVTPLDDTYRQSVTSAAPTLVVSGTLDGRTPVVNGEEALRGLPNGTHLTVGGASHGDDLFLSTPEILRAMLHVLGGRQPRLPRSMQATAR